MDNENIVYDIIIEHIIENIKILEKNRYNIAKYTLKEFNVDKLKENMYHDFIVNMFNKFLQNLLNSFYHMINTCEDENLNEIFNAIREKLFIHNSCLIQKYVDIFRIIYDNIDTNQLDYNDVDKYVTSFCYQLNLLLNLYKHDILKNLVECDNTCKMIYDPTIDPIVIN